MGEVNWREMFAVEEIVKPLNLEAGDCSANCQQAKELVCVCKCKGKNHGAALRDHVKPLDDFSEDPVPFSPEEYLEEVGFLS